MQENKMPYNLEAERALLNAVLTDQDAIIDIMEIINENDFFFEPHQIIYRIMKDLDDNNSSVDIVTVCDSLEKKGYLKKIGGLTYLEDLNVALPSAVNYKSYISIVQRDSMCRKLIKASNDISVEAYECEDSDILLANAEAYIYNISESKDTSKLQHASPIAAEVLNRINEAIADKDAFKGMPSYFENVDKLLNGLHKSDLMLIAARPSLGKTSFSMNLVANIVEKDPNKVIAVFSLEMAAEQLVQRMIATISKTSMADSQRGSLSIDALKKIYEANKIISNSKLFIDDSSLTSPAQILSKCRRLQKREGRLDLLVIDYLQLMVSNDPKASRQEVISDFSRRMKIIAKELNAPVILISQLSRAVERREDKVPQLSDLRESGSIEQDADIVMLLHKPQLNDIEDDNIRQLIVAKHRNGEVGSLWFKWKGPSLSFDPIPDPTLRISKSPAVITNNNFSTHNQQEDAPPFEDDTEYMPTPPPELDNNNGSLDF